MFATKKVDRSATGFGPRFGVVLVGWLTLFVFWNQQWLVNGPALCPFRLVTGHPCPFCGTTRALGAFSAGDFEQAWAFNPFGLTLSLVGVIAFLWPALRRKAELGLRNLSNTSPRALTAFVTVGIIAIWYWNITSRW